MGEAYQIKDILHQVSGSKKHYSEVVKYAERSIFFDEFINKRKYYND
jgi:hypothetical protein